MSRFDIKKGFDVKLSGRPSTSIIDCVSDGKTSLFPLEFSRIRQRLLVGESEEVKRGTALVEDKRNDQFKLRAPAGGTVSAIVRGERRFVEKIEITVAQEEAAESFTKCPASEITGMSREDVVAQLVHTGYLGFLRQRPLNLPVDPSVNPGAIFVNGMNTGPFQVSADVVTADDAEAFQAGLDVMTRLTDGKVYLSVAPGACRELSDAANVEVHEFSGPHPAGNNSVHIRNIAPMSPGDVVWTVKAVDLVPVGRLFLDGALPSTKIVSLGGPGVRAGCCAHYRVRIGESFDNLLKDKLQEGEQRIISGDALSGTKVSPDSGVGLFESSITVIPEGRDRRFLGWTSPGFNLLSFTRTVVSSWIGKNREWPLTTSSNGEERALVLTGHYDKVMPLDILTDFLIRAILAGDTDEAIELGILETAPEDFALCEFVCPSKLRVQEIIQKGLDLIEEEGI